MGIKTNYFEQAKSWSDDVFGALRQSRNRYKLAFLSAMFANVLAMVAVIILAQRQILTPLLIHHYTNGVITIDPLTKENSPVNKAQVESDILRYLTNRESYEVAAYRSQYSLVTLLSTDSVATEYSKEQSQAHKTSPINTLGARSERLVHVYSIHFLDNLSRNDTSLVKDHHNLAEAVFTLTDRDKTSGQSTERHYTALIGWEYTKPSKDPAILWQNWDGFLVTSYSKRIRNMSSGTENE